MKLERFVYWFGALFVVGTFWAFSVVFQDGAQAPAIEAAKKVTTDTGGPINNKTLVFSDEFDKPVLDGTKWATCYDWRLPTEGGCTNHGNFEQEWYTEDQVNIIDGQLMLTAEEKPMDVAVQKQIKSFRYRSGMINSGSGATNAPVRWAGTYGYYEAKMKVQTGQGVWPAFWLLPIDREWPPEIDIMEFIGHKPGEILQTLHWPGEGGPQKSDVIVSGQKDYSADWHVYAVDWRPDGIDWYIDGKKTRSYIGPNIPHKPMEIILNLAVGGLLPGNADDTTPFPREVRVDYVRVYQSSEQARPHHY